VTEAQQSHASSSLNDVIMAAARFSSCRFSRPAYRESRSGTRHRHSRIRSIRIRAHEGLRKNPILSDCLRGRRVKRSVILRIFRESEAEETN
jgi:hypothetical protein